MTNKFLIVSYALHKSHNSKLYSYAPYVREMNLWLDNVNSCRIIAPYTKLDPDPLEMEYAGSNVGYVPIPGIKFKSFGSILTSLFKLPVIIFKLLQGMFWADHIHLRCPGNIGLIASFCQVFFPGKVKTVKYANNWDPKSKQPISYRLQKWVLKNELLSKKMQILVYGEWNEKSKNVLPFFTASYTKDMYQVVPFKCIQDEVINFIFVGTLTHNKRAMECIDAFIKIRESGINATITLIGGGVQEDLLRERANQSKYSGSIIFTGKVSQSEVVECFKKSHFLIFLSKSEGWPKVVAESLWWGCIPISTDVSCVNYMLGNGSRGFVVEPEPDEVVKVVVNCKNNQELFQSMKEDGINWAREYTLEKFESEIKQLL